MVAVGFIPAMSTIFDIQNSDSGFLSDTGGFSFVKFQRNQVRLDNYATPPPENI
jgi:hypothetical protein